MRNIYRKNGESIEEAKQFLYEEEIYLKYTNRLEFYRSKLYKAPSPVSKSNASVYNEAGHCTVIRYWNLIGAPKQYLESKGFKPVV
jgi:hypothetical protein